MGNTFDINNTDHKALMNKILGGEMVLFLGSGFSMGAKSKCIDINSGGNRLLPSVNELKKLLSEEVLGDESYTDESLKEICEECKFSCQQKYADYMRKLFSVKDYTLVCG